MQLRILTGNAAGYPQSDTEPSLTVGEARLS